MQAHERQERARDVATGVFLGLWAFVGSVVLAALAVGAVAGVTAYFAAHR